MENYGLCSKVPYRGLEPYDGRVTVSTVGAERNVNMRVYDELKTVFDPLQRDPYGWINLDNMSKNRNEITMTPLSSFTWVLKGGSEDWFSKVELYLNGIRLDKNSR